MSEVTTIKTVEKFTDRETLHKAVKRLQAKGVQIWLSEEKPGLRAHHYFHGNKNFAQDPREGEKLSVIINQSWGDVAGISAEHGDLCGGVHRLGTPEGELSPTELEVMEKMRLLRVEYNTIRSEQAAKRIAHQFGGRIVRKPGGVIEIHTSGNIL